MENKKNVFEVSVKFNEKEFNDAIDKVFDKKKNDIKLDGFRKGKVPRDVYYKKMGKQGFYMDAVDVLLPEAYDRALKEGNYQPIIEPKVDLKYLNEDGVEFSFVITTMPEVEIKKYTGLKVKKAKVEVSQEEIDHEIEGMLSRYSELVVKEFGEVNEGDVAVIDFEGFKDGVAFDGGKGENYSLEIGSHTFIPGFEEQLVGMKVGEEKEINVTFPEEYQVEELKGQPVVFKVKVNEIKEKLKRELDEEFFEDLGLEGVNSKETLEEEIRKNIEVNKDAEAENAYIDELLKKISEQTTVEIADELLEDELHQMIHRFEDQLRMQGVSLDVFYEMTRSTEEDLKNQMKDEARNHILYRFIIETIRNKENITVTDEEVDKEVEELSKKYGVEKEEFIKMYGSLDMMKAELEVKKTIEFLKENN